MCGDLGGMIGLVAGMVGKTRGIDAVILRRYVFLLIPAPKDKKAIRKGEVALRRAPHFVL